MPPLHEVVLRLGKFPTLSTSITIEQLHAFLRLVSRLLPSIQSDEVNAGRSVAAELILPIPITEFLAAALNLPVSTVILCWAGFGDFAGENTNLHSDDELLASLGPSFGIVGDTLEPPIFCSTEMCRKARLTKRQEYSATLFTLRRGILPITIVSKYCQNCNTTYHHNYKIRHASQPEAQREYYGGVPELLMVSMHHVVERQLAVLWEVQMVFSQ
ncbi:hypothetical protein K438DRAFT_670588 [Mycena galopus ATCC 62051]|nr:hypothetical protein K438DRAFT_670588 [Mycena galopus ATCC 62051]